jgi:hypothetical protein
MSNKKTALLSALVACGVATSAIADVKVTLGGALDTQLGVVQQKKSFRSQYSSSGTGSKLRENALTNAGSVSLNADGSVEDMSLKYGAKLVFNANTSDAKGFSVPTSSSSAGSTVDSNVLKQASAYVETPFGKVEIGSTESAGKVLQVGAGQLAAASGGVNGDWVYYVNPKTSTGYLARFEFVQTPNLFSNEEGTVGTQSLYANKVNLFTPRLMGFTAGVSYIPDLGVKGTVSNAFSSTKLDSTYSNTSYREIFQGGINYENTFDGYGIKAAVLGETGKTSYSGTNKQRSLRGYEAGLNLSYMGVSLGGSYGSHGKSGALTSSELKNSKYWTLGAGYTYGPVSASLTYMDSSKGIADQAQANTLKTTSFGVNYKVAEGFMPYAEVTNFNFKDKYEFSKGNNKGNIFLVGSKFNF